MDRLPLLSILLLVLPAAAALIWVLPARRARALALGAAFLDLALALAVLARFDPARPGFQLLERGDWMPALGVSWALGVDGLSVLFLPAGALLFVATLVPAAPAHAHPRGYYSLLLLLQWATLGVFCALDAMLFFLCWELTILPAYFLVSLWGGARRAESAHKYALVMLAGGVPLLFGFLLSAFGQPAGFSFDMLRWLEAPLSPERQRLVFVLLLVGFAAKLPAPPLHTWLPSLAMEGPATLLALLTGLKLGAFGLLRWAVPLAPAAAQELHWLLAGLGTAGVVYGAIGALGETHLRRMLAYGSVSHVGLAVLGISSFSLWGLQGALLLLLNFVVASGGLFLLAALLQQRVGSLERAHLGGAAQSVPLLASFFLLFGLAGMGLPGTSGFPAELLILLSALDTHAGAALASLAASVVGAAYFLGFYRLAFLGPAVHMRVREARDLHPPELALCLALAFAVLALGLYPAALLELVEPAAQAWIGRLGR